MVNFILNCLVLITLMGCKLSQDAQPSKPPVPVVETTVIQPHVVTMNTELPGRTSPYRIAEIRPQVDGIIVKRIFNEGQDVQAHQQLFQIDDARYQALLNNAKGALGRAKANLPSLQAKMQRFKELSAMRAVSQQEYDDALAMSNSNEADIIAAQAAVQTAEINVGYTKIAAPISGRIGKSFITEGGLAVTNQPQPLAVVQQLDPIYVDITQPHIDILKLKRALKQGQVQSSDHLMAKVELRLDDGSLYSQTGTLEFTDITVEPTTGAVTVRAVFPNPHHELAPGMFVRAVLNQGQWLQALSVPQRAVSRNRNGHASVMIVNADNVTEIRKIETDQAVEDQWLVRSGITPGDRVIISGIQKIKPGIKVTFKDVVPAKN